MSAGLIQNLFLLSDLKLKQHLIIFLLGSDTTATALTCLLLTLIHHPNIQHQLWLEVQAKVGEHCLPSLADREQMPYFEATLLELLRCNKYMLCYFKL